MAGYEHGGYTGNKYIISKTNGHRIDPNAEYLVIRLDGDPHALIGAEAYANSVKKVNPEFAEGILERVDYYRGLTNADLDRRST